MICCQSHVYLHPFLAPPPSRLPPPAAPPLPRHPPPAALCSTTHTPAFHRALHPFPPFPAVAAMLSLLARCSTHCLPRILPRRVLPPWAGPIVGSSGHTPLATDPSPRPLPEKKIFEKNADILLNIKAVFSYKIPNFKFFSDTCIET